VVGLTVQILLATLKREVRYHTKALEFYQLRLREATKS
jgi:hypothetical protein